VNARSVSLGSQQSNRLLIDVQQLEGILLQMSALPRSYSELSDNPRVCFMSSGLINQEVLREQYPSLGIGCFIRKPITIENLIRRINAELE
jgi:hypothetical protein